MPFMAVTVLSDNGAFRNAFCDIYALPARSRGAVAGVRQVEPLSSNLSPAQKEASARNLKFDAVTASILRF